MDKLAVGTCRILAAGGRTWWQVKLRYGQVSGGFGLAADGV